MVWGSDWPHPTEKQNKPDDAVLLDCFAEAVPDEAARQRILVDNPAKLSPFRALLNLSLLFLAPAGAAEP